MSRRYFKIIAGLCVLLLVTAIAVGISQWRKYQRCKIGTGEVFQVLLPAHPRSKPGLQAIMVNLSNPGKTAVEVIFRLRRSALGWIGKTYAWDWESPSGTLADKSWIDQSMYIQQNGSVVSWDVEMSKASAMRLKIWRDLGDRWIVTAQSELVEAKAGRNHFILDPPLAVYQGSVIGFYSTAGGISLNSTSGFNFSIEQPLKASPTNYYSSSYREKEYIISGDAKVALKTAAVSAPHPGFAYQVELSPDVMTDVVGSIEGPAVGGGGTLALTVIDLEKSVPRSGSLQAWEAVSKSSGQARLKIWRREGIIWRVVAESPLQRVKAGLNHFSLDPPLLVQQNDYLGFYTDQGAGEFTVPAGSGSVKNQGKLYAAGNDIRGPIAESGMTRDTWGNYMFRAILSPAAPAGDIMVKAQIKPGRFTYRFALPDQVYALGEQVELSLAAGGNDPVYLYSSFLNILKSGNPAVGLNYGSKSTVSSAQVVPDVSKWPLGDLFLLAISIIGLYNMRRSLSGRGPLLLMGLVPIVALIVWRRLIPA
ncbi:MAG: hypothetical protein PHV60_05655, partial [bacterium]|nr:hypothetical protein [bacterium]